MRRFLFIILTALLACAASQAATRKVVYVVMDGIPADYIERVHPATVFDVARHGGYARASTGGEIGGYSQTPTISAVGYMNILTGTWLNKHNVPGNSNLDPNYNYWSLFRIAKQQPRNFTTALFSSWTDNRTVLIGAGKSETDSLSIDIVRDGYELEGSALRRADGSPDVFAIDSVVCREAAECIRTAAPDLSWVYLWYTDEAFHAHGDSSFVDEYVRRTDEQVARIWEAVQYREKNFDEEWMVIITTDHGRDESGHHHGGQSARERSVWISTNADGLNARFGDASLSLVDILPTICRFMGFTLPRDRAFELDGVPFCGKADISCLTTHPYDNGVELRWRCGRPKDDAVVDMAVTNNFKSGGRDEWIEVGRVEARAGRMVVHLDRYPESRFYKFVVATPHTTLNRWLLK